VRGVNVKKRMKDRAQKKKTRGKKRLGTFDEKGGIRTKTKLKQSPWRQRKDENTEGTEQLQRVGRGEAPLEVDQGRKTYKFNPRKRTKAKERSNEETA